MKRFTCILVLLATVTVASAQTDVSMNGNTAAGKLFLGITGGITSGIKIPHNLPDGGLDPANPIVSGDDKYRGFETGVTAGYGWDITGRWRVSLAGTVMYGMLYHLQTLTFSSKETQSRTFQIPYMEIGMLPRLTYSLTDYLSVGAGIGGCLRTSSLNEPNVFGPSRGYAISVNAGIKYRMRQHWYVEGQALYDVFSRTASPEYRGFLSPNGQVTATVGYEC